MFEIRAHDYWGFLSFFLKKKPIRFLPLPPTPKKEIRVWPRDPRSLQVVVASTKPKMRWGRGGVRLGLGPRGVCFPEQDAPTDSTLTISFDDEKDCLVARDMISDVSLKKRKSSFGPFFFFFFGGGEICASFLFASLFHSSRLPCFFSCSKGSR